NVMALANRKSIEVQSEIDDITLEADKGSLVKLFIILLDNAIKYSDENGQIILRARSSKNKVVISVQDFGAGIRAGDLPYIFLS
ncbi:MAG: sensor histidine kinase, partial [Actinobacteria bacterium]|nr:sensor histidine kinase [Actinomycetota bacterium]